MNKKVTKRALFMSFVSMFLCFTMLLGTTYAWFTDSVTSGVNTIVAGNLDVELYHTNKTVTTDTKVTEATTLFTDVEKWEPGVMVWEKFTVKNEGDLALKYLFTLNANNATVVNNVSFADLLKVAVIEKADIDAGFTYDRASIAALADSRWDTLKTFTLDGSLVGKTLDANDNEVIASETFGIVIYWEPSDNDNLFNMNNGKTVGSVKVDVGVNLFATQLEAENDSFGNDYDKEAADKIAVTTPVVDNEPTVLNAPVAPSTTNAVTTIEAPANAFGSDVKSLEAAVTPTSSLFDVSADGAVVGSIDVELTAYDASGNVITNFDNTLTSGVYTVTTYIAKGLANVAVAYNGDGNQPTIALVDYDAETGKLVFTTTHFSKYDVSGSALAYDLEADTAINDIKVIVAEQSKAESTVVVPAVNSEAVAEAVEDAIAEGDLEEDDVDPYLVYVAKVGDVFFASLDEAFAAIESEGTVVLNKDVSYTDKSFTIAGKKVTLNTNGNTLSDVSTASKTSYFFLVKNGATLTLTGNGTVSFRATTPDTNWGEGSTNKYPGYANNTFRNEGIIVVNGPTLENWTERGGASYVIDNYAGSSLTVESGVVAQRGDDIAIRTFATSATNGINVVVNGGELIGRRGIWVHLAGSDSAVAPKVDVTINGGKVTPSALALYSYSYGNSFANATIAINGGEFGGDIAFGGGYKGDVETVTFNKKNIKMAEGKTIIRYLTNIDHDILNDVYYVYSAAGLKEIAADVNAGNAYAGKTVALSDNIDLNNEEWTPIGNSTNSFQGTFDGKGYTVSNLKITGNNSYVGLFGFTTNGTIKNLVVKNALVSGRLGVGVVAGSPYTSKYENITVKGHVEVEGMSYVGGVGGKNAYANWTNITVEADDTSFVKANSVEGDIAYRTYVGGVIGFMGEGGHTVSNVTSNIDVIGSTMDVGGIVGIAHYGNNFVNVSCSGNVTVTDADEEIAEEIGGIAGVWHNESGTKVTFENCSFTGELSANVKGVDLSDNTIAGAAYSSTGTGELIIK